MKSPRILIADDHALVVEGFRRLLEPQFEIVGTAGDGREAVAKAKRSRPDVVIMDIAMPTLNGIDAARKIRETLPQTRVLFLSMHSDPAYVEQAFQAGGAGFLLKRSAGTELKQAIRDVMKGRFYLTPLMESSFAGQFLDGEFVGMKARRRGKTPSGLPRGLTPRQREVLQLVAEGKAIKEIATILAISTKTVEFHKSRIMDRLGVRTTAELTHYAMRQGLIFPG